MNVLTDAYSAYQNYKKDYPNHKLKVIVNDLKESLKDERIPKDMKVEIAKKIAAYESQGKSTQAKGDLFALAIDVTNMAAGSFGGVVGSGLASLATSKFERSNNLDRKAVIRKAQKVGGRRIAAKGNEKYYQTKKEKVIPDQQSLKDSISTTATDAIQDYATSLLNPIGLLTRGWELIGSFLR